MKKFNEFINEELNLSGDKYGLNVGFEEAYNKLSDCFDIMSNGIDDSKKSFKNLSGTGVDLSKREREYYYKLVDLCREFLATRSHPSLKL
jgi:hypothetical protein